MSTLKPVWGPASEEVTNDKLNQGNDWAGERLDREAALSKLYAQNFDTTIALVWGYYGGTIRNGSSVVSVADGTVNLTASTTNYVEADPTSGAVSLGAGGFTSGKWPLRKIVTGGAAIVAGAANNVDCRSFFNKLPIAASDLPSGIDATKIGAGTVSNTVFGYLAGVTSAIQGQIDAKASAASLTTHTSDTAPHSATAAATASRLMLRDASGRAQVADGVADADIATVGQVNAARSGLSIKDPVRVATTANITLSGTQTIDGVAVIAGDRVLAKNQTTASQNGIYVVAAGAWSRATDANTSAKLVPGSVCWVNEGAANGDKRFALTTDAPITLGTTSLTFIQDSSSSGVSAVTASGGLASSGGATPDISISDNGVTDTKIGNRTIDQTTALGGTPNVGVLTTLLGRIANVIKTITGKTNWYDAPDAVLGDAVKLQGRTLMSTLPSDGQVVTWNDSLARWEPATPPGAGGGEANTASNLGGGTDGEGLFSGKSGVDLQFKRVKAGIGVALASGTNSVEFSATAYDIAGSVVGKPSASATVARLVAVRDFKLPASLTGSQAKAGTAATASTTFSIRKNGVECATFNFAAAATSATFTNAAEDTFAAGDVLTIVAPAQDATLADIGFTLKAVQA